LRYAGLTGDEHDLPATSFGVIEVVPQQAELALAADQRRQPTLDGGFEPRTDGLLANGLVGGNRVRLSLEWQLAERLELEVVLCSPSRRLRQIDGPRLCRRFEPRRDVDRVADRRVVHVEVVADAPDHHRAGVHADAELAVDRVAPLHLVAVLRKGRLHFERGSDGTACGVLMSDRGSEQGHDAIAQELGDRALVAMHCIHHSRKAALHERIHLLLIQSLRDGREAHRVREQNGDGATLALERGTVAQDFLGQVRRGVCARIRDLVRTGRRSDGGRVGQLMPAGITELLPDRVGGVAARARDLAHQRRTAFPTESCAGPIFVAA
jgi:hypothetical protein